VYRFPWASNCAFLGKRQKDHGHTNRVAVVVAAVDVEKDAAYCFCMCFFVCVCVCVFGGHIQSSHKQAATAFSYDIMSQYQGKERTVFWFPFGPRFSWGAVEFPCHQSFGSMALALARLHGGRTVRLSATTKRGNPSFR